MDGNTGVYLSYNQIGLLRNDPFLKHSSCCRWSGGIITIVLQSIPSGLYSLRERRLLVIRIPNISLRPSSDRHMFTMGIPISIRRRHLRELNRGPANLLCVVRSAATIMIIVSVTVQRGSLIGWLHILISFSIWSSIVNKLSFKMNWVLDIKYEESRHT